MCAIRKYLAVITLLTSLCVLISSEISFQSTSSSNDNSFVQKKSVIVFGGNGFMGAATVEKLVREGFYVVIINRGTWYWDSETRIKPFVVHIRCDRADSLRKCGELQKFIWSETSPSYFDVLIDFSGYHVFQVSEALRMFEGKVMKYIFISSDSVYEVSNKTHKNPSKEEDALRPESIEERRRLNDNDDYGHRKLECEEKLVRQSVMKGGVPYVILRLPDVVGPRDTTYRWWIYQLWIKLSEYLDKPVSVPAEFWITPISLVYVDDVAEAILTGVKAGTDLHNEVFNLALEEVPTLVEYLHALMDALEMEDIDIDVDAGEESFRQYPSVYSGPVDISKAKAKLNWKPTPWRDVVDTTVAFYENAMKSNEFEKEKREVITTVQQRFSKDPMNVLKGLKNKYGLDFGLKKRDEL